MKSKKIAQVKKDAKITEVWQLVTIINIVDAHHLRTTKIFKMCLNFLQLYREQGQYG